jgi:sugar/nucleoside kinase (ribokinase family)
LGEYFNVEKGYLKMTTQYGVTAIGNAIVDILAHASDEFIASQAASGMQRGAMSLITAERATELYNLMGPATEMSGGSAGNTMACFASFGGKGAYIGKVANDQLGRVFAHDTRSIGVHFDTPPLENGKPTAQCLILVTPDAQRTMNTFLGASTQITDDDVNEDLIASSQVTYLEGYLFDDPLAKAAFFKAAEYVAKHKQKLSLSLSDPFCVIRHRDDFKRLVENHVDILFTNEEELQELTEIPNTEQAIEAIRGQCDIVAVTLGAKGSAIVTLTEIINIPPIMPTQLIDTTGAGDAYAAGFLFGLTEGKDLKECGRLGSLAASEIISHMGPRPLISLKGLL